MSVIEMRTNTLTMTKSEIIDLIHNNFQATEYRMTIFKEHEEGTNKETGYTRLVIEVGK
jgi:hypothetical protein